MSWATSMPTTWPAIGASFHGARLIGGAGHGPLHDQRHPRRPAHHVHLSRRGHRTGAGRRRSGKVIEGAAITYLEGYLFDSGRGPQAPSPRPRVWRGPATAPSPCRCRTASWSIATARRLLAFIAAEVDILFANEDEITALTGADQFRRCDRRGHPRQGEDRRPDKGRSGFGCGRRERHPSD